jgi:hypothetical protein
MGSFYSTNVFRGKSVISVDFSLLCSLKFITPLPHFHSWITTFLNLPIFWIFSFIPLILIINNMLKTCPTPCLIRHFKFNWSPFLLLSLVFLLLSYGSMDGLTVPLIIQLQMKLSSFFFPDHTTCAPDLISHQCILYLIYVFCVI